MLKQLKLINIPLGAFNSFIYVNNCASWIGFTSETDFCSTTIDFFINKSHLKSTSNFLFL